LIEGPAANAQAHRIDHFSLSATREAYAAGEAIGGGSATSGRKNDPERVPKHDPLNVPDPVELNERQRWFLDRVVEGRCGATEIAAVWEVSLKTARRDIGALQKARLLEYVGSRRKGRYRRTT
jgi:hypothetical protein